MATGTSERLTVVIVGDQGSVHVRRWSAALIDRGCRVVPIDLARRGRPIWRIAGGLVAARRRVGRLARQPQTVIALHYVRGGLVAAGLRGVHPLVASVWGRDITAVRGGLWGRFHAAQLRALLRGAEAVTATSHFLSDVARERFGVASTVIPFGVDTSVFAPPPAVPESSARPKSAPLRIGFVKWLEAKYGPDTFVEALGLLGDLSFEATIVGDGPLRGALEARAAELGVADRVRFLGRRPHDEMPDLLRGFDLVAMPSRQEEWGVAAAEAGATAIPVVAARVGGLPEIVVDGETGLLVPPEDPAALADAIRRMAADPGLRLRLGAAARERVVALFPWEKCVDQMLEVLTAAAR